MAVAFIEYGVSPGTTSQTCVITKPEQPYKSWIWKDNQWNAPVAYPDADKDYIWNEEKLNWELN